MENIMTIEQCFNVAIANAETKKYNNENIEKSIIDLFNNHIIPAIHNGLYKCEYSDKNGGYIDDRIVKKLKDMGYCVYNHDNNTRINIYWSSHCTD